MEQKDKDKEEIRVILIFAFLAFLMGFLVAEAIYNEEARDRKEYIEQQWYE